MKLPKIEKLNWREQLSKKSSSNPNDLILPKIKPISWGNNLGSGDFKRHISATDHSKLNVQKDQVEKILPANDNISWIDFDDSNDHYPIKPPERFDLIDWGERRKELDDFFAKC
jgi:hypothetical protein